MNGRRLSRSVGIIVFADLLISISLCLNFVSCTILIVQKKTLSEVERSCNAIIAPLRRRITRPEVVQEGERAKRKHDSDKAILSKWQKLRRSLSAVKAMPPAKYASGK
jgi:hypothetical protein